MKNKLKINIMNILINLLIVILLIVVFLWLLAEVVTLFIMKLPLFKKLDLTQTEINTLKNNILTFSNSNIKNKFDYITNTPIPILFPYYISINNYKNSRTIMRFSKNYFLIKNKYKELNKNNCTF